MYCHLPLSKACQGLGRCASMERPAPSAPAPLDRSVHGHGTPARCAPRTFVNLGHDLIHASQARAARGARGQYPGLHHGAVRTSSGSCRLVRVRSRRYVRPRPRRPLPLPLPPRLRPPRRHPTSPRRRRRPGVSISARASCVPRRAPRGRARRTSSSEPTPQRS